MRVLLFGGSFDPPHAGHAALARAAIKTLRPEKTVISPAYRSPFKTGHSAPAADRLTMSRILAKAIGGGARVDPWELGRGQTTYTVELLRRWKRLLPGAELWFLVGSDAAAGLPRWRGAKALSRLAFFAVGLRPKAPMPQLTGFCIRRVPGRFPDLSSTSLRARLLAAPACAEELMPAVATYIGRRGLYGARLRERLEGALSPHRFAHSMAVARLAVRLAERWDEDAEAAALAGVLHDAGRSLGLHGMAKYARRRRLAVPALEETARKAPLLLHAYVGADLARRDFGVEDPAVLRAIASHTLGRPNMSRLERVLYIADLASEDRDFREAAQVRKLAFRDLDAAFRRSVRIKLAHARREGAWVHPMGPRLARAAGAK